MDGHRVGAHRDASTTTTTTTTMMTMRTRDACAVRAVR
jgi:hypothetical protein